MTIDQPQAPTRVGGLDGAGTAAVLTAVTLMGIGSVVAKASAIDGPVLALHRAWLAAVLYLGLFLAFRGRINVVSLRAAAPGGLFFGVQLAFFFSAIQLTTVANATMLIALQPVAMLLFFSKRFGETVTRRELLLATVALIGVAIVVFGSTASPSWSPIGDMLALGALGMWTLYFVASKTARQSLGAVEYQGLSLVFSSLVMLPVAMLFSGTVDPGAGKWWWIAAMVAIPGTGHLSMNWAHPRVPLTMISEFTLLSPVISVALAAAVLEGETVNVAQIIGMATVLTALGILVKDR
ncbi:MAG: DMT family transporter [Acidimicrobiales bacterium]